MSTHRVDDPGSKPDRQAIEQLVGHPLPTEWPSGALPAGSRVMVVRAGDEDRPWRQEFTGTIDCMAAPEPVRHAHAHKDELKYWVTFDEAQYDSSGDGPYRKAQIWDRYLRPA